MYNAEEFGARVKLIRKRENLTQLQFAEKIGIKRNTIAQYEIGRNIPLDPIVKAICEKFHINEVWLRTGEGDMKAPEVQDDELLDFITEVFQSPTDDARRRVIAVLSKLPPEWYDVLVEKATELVDKCRKEKEEG